MQDPLVYLAIATTALAALGMMTAAALAGWRGWLALKRHELSLASDGGVAPAASAGQRIEIADLKERLRKLEAIAAGVDL
ncbi:hypothetical protein [Sphingomonas baiyangensis]|uniref:Uncharacterized protein n=1 Tax=Sphingomonas baiyangensis TaxID=2572576 RepID=A0A4U1L2P9_9SPHN|nr:hypothetical protein [Sphingomonas baiyangensis]TKD50892.1 hypothetical protein FBR43_09040 [Sphingomonas baiyangensis]